MPPHPRNTRISDDSRAEAGLRPQNKQGIDPPAGCYVDGEELKMVPTGNNNKNAWCNALLVKKNKANKDGRGLEDSITHLVQNHTVFQIVFATWIDCYNKSGCDRTGASWDQVKTYISETAYEEDWAGLVARNEFEWTRAQLDTLTPVSLMGAATWRLASLIEQPAGDGLSDNGDEFNHLDEPGFRYSPFYWVEPESEEESVANCLIAKSHLYVAYKFLKFWRKHSAAGRATFTVHAEPNEKTRTSSGAIRKLCLDFMEGKCILIVAL